MQRSVVLVKGAEVQILLKKRNHAVWTRLLKSKEKVRKYVAKKGSWVLRSYCAREKAAI